MVLPMLLLIHELGLQSANALLKRVGPHSSLPDSLPIQLANRTEFGELQTSACLALAKPLSRSPKELASFIQEDLKLHPAIEKVEIAGAGYVNFYLKTNWLEEKLEILRQNEQRGLVPMFEGQTVVVDFSGPNIAKPMHVGHIRSTVIGDALQRILRAVGYTVISDNHLGDWGTQFGKLIVAYKHFLNRSAYQINPIGELVRLYQLFSEEEKKQASHLGIKKQVFSEETDPVGISEESPTQSNETEEKQTTPLMQEARSELAKLQQGDAQNLALWDEFVRVSLETFAQTYRRLGVHFDLQLGESFYHPYLAPLVEKLLQDGIAQKSQGATICEVEKEPAPLIIQKEDGAFLYGTTDLATICYRIEQWEPSRILYVVGAPQELHFRLLFAVAKKMGSSCSFEHLSFGSILFWNEEQKKWAVGGTRKGNAPLLEQLLDEAVNKAKSVILDKNPELSIDEVEKIAPQVGLGALKYNMLNRDRNLDIRFDVKQAVSLEGNTAPYIQYAYARIRSIQRKASVLFELKQGYGDIKLEAEIEKILAKKLMSYSIVVDQVARSTKIHMLTEYLYELAFTLSQFYHEIPVLKEQVTTEQRNSRLALIEEVAKTLKNGLYLLGIEAPEQM